MDIEYIRKLSKNEILSVIDIKTYPEYILNVLCSLVYCCEPDQLLFNVRVIRGDFTHKKVPSRLHYRDKNILFKHGSQFFYICDLCKCSIEFDAYFYYHPLCDSKSNFCKSCFLTLVDIAKETINKLKK